MNTSICRLFIKVPPGTAIKRLKMNGDYLSGIEEFVKFDEDTGLVFLKNMSNDTLVVMCEKIDMIEFDVS